jgi:hypothetical protein
MITTTALLVLAVLMVVGWRAITNSPEPAWLMSIDALSGELIDNGDQGWILELRGIDSHVTAFTDRPDRRTWLVPTYEIVASWDTLFGGSAPNAVLSEHGTDGARQVVVELGSPTTGEATLRYGVTILEVTDGSRSGLQPPSRFGPATLFIDDTNLGPVQSSGQCGSCWGS